MSDYVTFNDVIKVFTKGSCKYRTIDPKWEYVRIGNRINLGETRLYYISEDGLGFDFFVVESISSPEGYAFEGHDVQVIYHGTAYYDGVRHLYMNYSLRENCTKWECSGYIHYPNFKQHIAVLNAIMELENKFCNISELDHGWN